MTPVGSEQQSQRPAKKRKKQAAAASDTPAAATGTSTTDKPVYDKVLYQAAREAWQKASSSKGVGALMFDHQFSTVRRRSDVIDEGITNYVHRNFRYLVGEHRDMWWVARAVQSGAPGGGGHCSSEDWTW